MKKLFKKLLTLDFEIVLKNAEGDEVYHAVEGDVVYELSVWGNGIITLSASNTEGSIVKLSNKLWLTAEDNPSITLDSISEQIVSNLRQSGI